jgi:cell division protein FtsQ
MRLLSMIPRASKDAPEVDAVPEESTDSGIVADETDEPTDVRAQSRAEDTVHRRILARRDSVALETKMASRQMRTWAVGGLLLGASLIALVFFTPVLGVRDVDVRGAVHEDEAAVVAAAGLPEGATLAEIPVRSIASGVETLAWVRRAEVTRKLPWTVQIKVIERTPVAIVDAAGTRGLVDEDGVVLEYIPPGANPLAGSLPNVSGSVPLPEPGRRWADEDGAELLVAASEIPAELVPHIARVWIEDGHMNVVLRGDTPVRFGPPEAVAHKSAVLLALLEDLTRRQVVVSLIDVSAVNSPAVTPAPTS